MTWPLFSNDEQLKLLGNHLRYVFIIDKILIKIFLFFCTTFVLVISYENLTFIKCSEMEKIILYYDIMKCVIHK